MTVPEVSARAGGDRLVMVTAYDYPSALAVARSDADIILVGDSLAMVALGHRDTLSITVDQMAYHVEAVKRANPKQLIVADMPWMSFHVSAQETLHHGAKLIRAGADCVKLEGAGSRVEMVSRLVEAEIAVMGHIGLTPQSVNTFGGYKVQGKTDTAAHQLIKDAVALEDAGCFAVVVEGVPRTVGTSVTKALAVPTIGIGAGPDCDGQVLVYHDLLGLQDSHVPKFVRQYANLMFTSVAGLNNFAADVRSGAFPNDSESYHSPR